MKPKIKFYRRKMKIRTDEKMKVILFCVISTFMICISYAQNNDLQLNVSKHEQQIPIFDKNKQYPKKIIKREIAEETYIALETTPEVLLDQDAVLTYVSDQRMLVFNRKIGDIFIFGMDGKALFNFNHRGPDG